MFVRTKHDRNRNLYRVQIVHNYRTQGKVRQKVLRHVASCQSQEELEPILSLAHHLLAQMRQCESQQMELFTPREYASLMMQLQSAQRPKAAKKLNVDLGECQETGRVMVGIREVFSRLYREFGWERLFGARKQSANAIIKELVMARIWQPRSKRASVAQLQAEAGIALNLDRVYRSMDHIDESCIDRIRRDCHAQVRSLFSQPVDILFYDLTTLYFESEKDDDALRRFGYSKDGKPNRTQVVLALIVNEVGLPVGYEVFAGDTFEGKTLQPVIEAVRAKYTVSKMTMVADSALLSRANQKLLNDLGVDYIVGYRLKSSRKAIKDRILDRSRYHRWDDGQRDGDDEFLYQVIEDGGNRIVVTYSSRRARKDRRNREKAIERLEKRLSKSNTVASVVRGDAARYLNIDSEGTAKIDADRIEQQARFDGLWALIASGNEDLSATELVGQYRKLWQVEHGFRTNKHDLRVRPIFHWSVDRIHAHLAICFMAYCLVEHLRYRLRVMGHPMSVQVIREHLSRLQFSMVQHLDGPDRYALPSSISAEARYIYRAVGLKWNPYPFRLKSFKGG